MLLISSYHCLDLPLKFLTNLRNVMIFFMYVMFLVGQPVVILFNTLPPIMPTWWPCELRDGCDISAIIGWILVGLIDFRKICKFCHVSSFVEYVKQQLGDTQNLYLAFGFMVVTNEILGLGMRTLVWR